MRLRAADPFAAGLPREPEEGRKAETQARIVEAAVALFATRGYDRASITAIAARAGVSRATIFWHFGDKATLFQETCRHFLVPFRGALEQSVVHLDPYVRIVDAISTYEHFVEENRATIHAFVSWIFSSPEQADPLREELIALHRAFLRVLTRSLSELIDDPTDVNAVATSMASLLHGNMLLSLGGAGEDEYRRTGLLREFLDLALSKHSTAQPPERLPHGGG